MHFLMMLDCSAIRAVAQGQIQPARGQSVAYILEATILQGSVRRAGWYIRNRKMRKYPLCLQAGELSERKNFRNRLPELPRREAEPRHSGVQLEMNRQLLSGSHGGSGKQFRRFTVVNRRGDMLFDRLIHISRVDIP